MGRRGSSLDRLACIQNPHACLHERRCRVALRGEQDIHSSSLLISLQIHGDPSFGRHEVTSGGLAHSPPHVRLFHQALRGAFVDPQQRNGCLVRRLKECRRSLLRSQQDRGGAFLSKQEYSCRSLLRLGYRS